MKSIALGVIRLYRLAISPALPPACRYFPTCSEYCLEAIERHGVLPGLWLGLRRLSRCHPWGPAGYDPVPERRRTCASNRQLERTPSPHPSPRGRGSATPSPHPSPAAVG